MDNMTELLYDALVFLERDKTTISYPQLLIECHVLEGELMSFIMRKDFHADYFAYIDRYPLYAEWYRVLAYGVYGYGNWSNNDRRRHGLPARRSTKANRRKGLR